VARRGPDPVRTCVGCRTATTKRDLIRLVRGPDGVIAVDPTGRAAGRGAYVHPHPACWDAALKRGAIGRALRSVLQPGEASTLRNDIEGAVRR
jgi:uncharacterized protein